MSWKNPPEGVEADKATAVLESSAEFNQADLAESIHKSIREYFPKNAHNPSGYRLAHILAERFYPAYRACEKFTQVVDLLGLPKRFQEAGDNFQQAMESLKSGPSHLPEGLEVVTVPAWAGEVIAASQIGTVPIVVTRKAVFRLDIENNRLVALTFREGELQ